MDILCPKKKKKMKSKTKIKSLLELKMTAKCLKCLFQQCRGIRIKISWPLKDAKTSDFRYKWYKISLDVTGNNINIYYYV